MVQAHLHPYSAHPCIFQLRMGSFPTQRRLLPRITLPPPLCFRCRIVLPYINSAIHSPARAPTLCAGAISTAAHAAGHTRPRTLFAEPHR